MPTTHLPDNLFQYLSQGCSAILATRDEAGWPHLVMSRAIARDSQTVRFIADHSTITSVNLKTTSEPVCKLLVKTISFT